jgi:phosphoribosylanthranilate isomerase
MRLKICGMKYEENLEQIVSQIIPDYLGFIFYEKSPRYFVDNLTEAAVNKVPDTIKKVGVFVNQSTSYIIKQIQTYNLYAVQLHGNESPEQCLQIKDQAIVIKAFGVNEHFDFEKLNDYAVNYFLFDTAVETYGGSGQKFNWEILNKYNLQISYFLSGGISNENIGQLKNISNKPFAIDVNSKYELEPGLKDLNKLIALKNILKENELYSSNIN